jgi:hypothetical protein
VPAELVRFVAMGRSMSALLVFDALTITQITLKLSVALRQIRVLASPALLYSGQEHLSQKQ